MTLAQQRPVPPAFARSTLQSRVAAPIELEPHQPVPQPFRHVAVPLYKGRGFSLDGQEPKPFPLVTQTFPQRPTVSTESNEFKRIDSNADAANEQQPARPQQVAEKILQQADKVQQQQERIQQQTERIQQQPEKQFSGFRAQVNFDFCSLFSIIHYNIRQTIISLKTHLPRFAQINITAYSRFARLIFVHF